MTQVESLTPTTEFERRYPELLDIANTSVQHFADDLRVFALGEEPEVGTGIDSYISLLERGGKRTRGVLAMTGYELYGGTDRHVAETAAGIVEAIHAYLLIVDDVADASDLRRGGPTAHIYLRDHYEAQGMTGDVAKLGCDAAINAALIAQHRAQQKLIGLEGVPAEHRLLAGQVLNDGLTRTGIGQMLDLVSAQSPSINRETILAVAKSKTAYYSFQLPLQVGAALAGAPEAELGYFAEYSELAGLAFQLHDDVISIFGNESETGKSRMSDIREGKRTLLLMHTLELASGEQRTVLLSALGNPNLTEDHFLACLDIIQSTGALQEVKQTINEYACRAMHAIAHTPATWPPAQISFLQGLALYSTKRKS